MFPVIVFLLLMLFGRAREVPGTGEPIPTGCRFNPSISTRGSNILSEFYHLRRTAIKDVVAYIGFLAGFIGAAPFAWGLLSDQLQSGSFVRGLWYFFGIVVAAGVFTGTAGLGAGHVVGILWEQFHRHRRRVRLHRKALADAEVAPPEEPAIMPTDPPQLRLVSSDRTDRSVQ
jgi:hypothetical protein